MSEPGRYCKAYYLRDVSRFAGWASAEPTGAVDIVYVHDDFTVTESVAHDDGVLYRSADPAWHRYCRDVLRFTVPDWCRGSIAPAV